MTQQCLVKNLKETKKLATKFAKTLVGGTKILLNGDLGAGKTTFTRFLAQALGVKDEVTSPTFTIMKEYQGKRYKLLHFDMYRLSGGGEANEFGFEDYLFNVDYNSIIVIEWSERVKDMLKGDFVTINIERIDENKRKFTIIKD